VNVSSLSRARDMEGFIGHVVAIRYLEDGFLSAFPPVTDAGLAAELAGMLRGAQSGTEVIVIHHAYDSDQRAKADEDTERLKRRLVDARDTAEPGRAFLQGLDCRFDKE